MRRERLYTEADQVAKMAWREAAASPGMSVVHCGDEVGGNSAHGRCVISFSIDRGP